MRGASDIIISYIPFLPQIIPCLYTLLFIAYSSLQEAFQAWGGVRSINTDKKSAVTLITMSNQSRNRFTPKSGANIAIPLLYCMVQGKLNQSQCI